MAGIKGGEGEEGNLAPTVISKSRRYGLVHGYCKQYSRPSKPTSAVFIGLQCIYNKPSGC